MKNIKKNATEIIGHTPLVELNNYGRAHDLKAKILAKLEYLNPSGSVKDRAALYMIEEAEKIGYIRPESTIIEATSGNMGISLAFISAIKGYRLILTMPDTMSVERRQILTAYGAEIVLTEGSKGMDGAKKRAEELEQEIWAGVYLRQFQNWHNAEAHTHTTAPEIWNDTAGEVDAFVAGVGSGGTITGAGVHLKIRKSTIKIVAVEPSGSPVLSGGKKGSHGIQGIGAGFVPAILDVNGYDEIITVSDADACTACREIAKKEGLLVGISSGAALHAAAQMAKRPELEGKNIVVIFPDSGDRYLSTSLFANGEK